MEIIKLQQLEADEKVVVDFLTVKSTTDLYGLVKDDLLLVKRQLTAEDARWLQSFKGHCDVFTMFPESIEAFDAGSEIGINEVASIGLCFLHTGDSLYVFDNDISKSETPNVVRISPVRRKEIGTYISVDEKVVAPVESSGTENPALEQEHNSEPVELSLLRKKVCEYFSAHFTEVRVEFSGTSPENRTISLSYFYKRHNIESGRLRGSWSLFDKSTREQLFDSGIVNKAKEAELKKLSVSIPSYGRIIRSEKLDLLQEKMERIEKDYRMYLDGKTACKKVGEVPVQKQFAPWKAIDESFSGLKNYLYRLGAEMNAGAKYQNAVDNFIFSEQLKHTSFSENVKLQIMSSTFTERQWENKDFVARFWRTVLENPDFFTEEFANLLWRYYSFLENVADANNQR